MGDHVIGLVAGGVCKTIAMGSELIAGNKGKQSAAARRAFEAEQSGGPQQNDSRDDDNLTMQEWALDDIESELTAERRDITPTESNTTPAKPEDQALTFINDHENELQHSSSGRRPIPQAVLIPQRRPGNRQRGFIRAHAPILNEYAGISQDMFMDFLRDFDKASKSSPVFNVINMACFGIGLVPSSICLAVSTAVGTANQIAQELQMRFRTNTFLDKINEALFMPCGLLAMVMAYKPDSPDDLILQADTTSPTDRATFKTVQVANNKTKQLLRRIRMHSGKATDVGIPECAPLVYPALDLALASNRLTEQKSLLSRNAEIVNDYLDRRAQTDFTQKHPTSKITSALPPQEKPYVNRYADPNHPVNNGSLFGMLTGGAFDPIGAGRITRAEDKAKKQGEPPLTAVERHDALMGRKVRGRVTGTPSKSIPLIGKILQKDVLYLIIVNLPTEQEMEQLREQIQRAKREEGE